MNPLQVEYFRQKLLHWRAQLLAESSDTLQHLKEESLLKPDLTDRASLETERAIDTHGVAGLRVTRLQIYRDTPPARLTKPRF